MRFKEEYSDYLEHHGVKGMKWGVRKEQYKALNSSQRRALKALGEGSVAYNRNKRKLAKGKNLSNSQKEYMKNYESVKKAAEQILKLKIDDKSLESSRRGNMLIASLLSPIAANVISSNRFNRFQTMSIANDIDVANGVRKR